MTEPVTPQQSADAGTDAAALEQTRNAVTAEIPVVPEEALDEDTSATQATPEDSSASEDAEAGEEDAPRESAEERVQRLEEEGDIAADYLEELLDIADFDGDIDIDVDGDRASVEIRGADRLARLNAPRGELLDALQELARLAVQTRTGERSRLMLDIGGFRAEHRTQLQELAAKAVADARSAGSPVPLRPMNPFERKVVHDVAKQEGLRSESDGDGKDRHVVIYPSA